MAGPSGSSQYDDRDQYNTPRYPGSDAPGYSGNPAATAASSGYGQTSPGQYSAANAQYSAPSSGGSYGGYGAQSQYAAPQDPRYGNQPLTMGGYSAQPDTNPASYVSVGANRTVANPQAYRSQPQYDATGDVLMTSMTSSISNPTAYATAGGPQGGYGPQSSYYAQPNSGGYTQPPMQPVQQPHDPFMGRKPADPRADPRTTSPAAATAPAPYPGTTAGRASPSYAGQTQYDDREQPQSRSGHQGQSSSSNTRHKDRSHHSSSRHKEYR
jgi:hypothetical protein